MGFQASSIRVRKIVPQFCTRAHIFFRLQQIDKSFVDLQNFLNGAISSKQEELVDQTSLDVRNKNLFTRVVMSSLQEGTKGLDTDGIIGNLFIYLFAGVRPVNCVSLVPIADSK